MNVLPLSFSRMSTFEQCGRRFEYQYVRDDIRLPNDQHDSAIYGSRVHEKLEKYCRVYQAPALFDALLALEEPGYFDEIKQWLPMVDRMLHRRGDKHFELETAVRRDRTACAFDAPDAWVRGILDVLIKDGTTAYVFDWKTGKIRESSLQLIMFAMLTFALYPQVNEVRTAYVWLHHNDVSTSIYHRSKLEHLWNSVTPRLDRVVQAAELGVFTAAPGPLCKWCPAKQICPDRR
jgi:predicted RecB family nuclease